MANRKLTMSGRTSRSSSIRAMVSFMQANSRAIVERADMRGNESLAPARHRDRGLQMRAERQRIGAIVGEFDRLGNKAARAAQKGRGAGDHRDDAIVGAGDNFSIVADDEIGDPGKPCARLIVVAMSGSPPGLALVATRTKSSGASRQARPVGRPAAAWSSR